MQRKTTCSQVLVIDTIKMLSVLKMSASGDALVSSTIVNVAAAASKLVKLNVSPIADKHRKLKDASKVHIKEKRAYKKEVEQLRAQIDDLMADGKNVKFLTRELVRLSVFCYLSTRPSTPNLCVF